MTIQCTDQSNFYGWKSCGRRSKATIFFKYSKIYPGNKNILSPKKSLYKDPADHTVIFLSLVVYNFNLFHFFADLHSKKYVSWHSWMVYLLIILYTRSEIILPAGYLATHSFSWHTCNLCRQAFCWSHWFEPIKNLLSCCDVTLVSRKYIIVVADETVKYFRNNNIFQGILTYFTNK